MLSTIVDSINPMNVKAYDQGCVEELQNVVKDSFEGERQERGNDIQLLQSIGENVSGDDTSEEVISQ